MAKVVSKKVGRPSSMTTETIAKLEEVFAIGGSDTEACFYADIATTTLYEYQQNHPEFTARKVALRENPILKARRTVMGALGEPEHAKWYLSRKKKDEFSEKTEVDNNIHFEPITFVIKGKKDAD
jgi:hypothetical protein